MNDYLAFIETLLALDQSALPIPKVSPQRRTEIFERVKAAQNKWNGSAAALGADLTNFASDHRIELDSKNQYGCSINFVPIIRPPGPRERYLLVLK